MRINLALRARKLHSAKKLQVFGFRKLALRAPG